MSLFLKKSSHCLLLLAFLLGTVLNGVFGEHQKPVRIRLVDEGIPEEEIWDFEDESDAPPPASTWNVTDPTTNSSCILLRAAISISVNYTDLYNTSRLVHVHVPPTADTSGDCRVKEGLQQTLQLTWIEHTNSTQQKNLNNTVTLLFQNVGGNGSTLGSKYAIVKVTLVLQKLPNLFPNATNPSVPFVITQDGMSVLTTSLNHSFVCSSAPTQVSVKHSNINEPDATLNFEDLQVEAFRKPQGKDIPGKFLGGEEHCSADEISSGSIVGTVVVTILVIILAALGVAALATYILKKRKAAGATGYENM